MQVTGEGVERLEAGLHRADGAEVVEDAGEVVHAGNLHARRAGGGVKAAMDAMWRARAVRGAGPPPYNCGLFRALVCEEAHP